MASFTVTAPLVQVRLDTGGYAHVYEGGQLPDNADPEHIKLLEAGGLVEKTAASPAADDGKPGGKKQARGQASAEE